jgi:ribosomal protein L28
MKSRCEICTKSRLRGKWVPRLIGRRIPRRTTRFQKPNIQKITLEGETHIVCTQCLKTIKRYAAESEASLLEA